MENERPTPLVDDIDGTRTKLEAWFSERRGTPVTMWIAPLGKRSLCRIP